MQETFPDKAASWLNNFCVHSKLLLVYRILKNCFTNEIDLYGQAKIAGRRRHFHH